MEDDPILGESRYTVPALERGLRILTLFDAHNRQLTLSEIARGVGLTRSTVFRLVHTLEQGGFIQKVRERYYQLGSAVLTLGFSFIAEQETAELARPVLERLRDLTNASAHLGILEGREVVYLARAPSRQMLISNIGVGSRLPAHQTTIGRILLAALSPDALRRLYDNFAFSEGGISGVEELIRIAQADQARGFVATESAYGQGIVSVAAPVQDRVRAVVAAVNVSAPEIALPLAKASKQVAAQVVMAAEELSQALGHRRRQTKA